MVCVYRKQARVRLLRRVQQQSVVKVIGGIQNTTAASPSGLTAETPFETTTLYTATSPAPPPPPPPPDPGCGTGTNSPWTPSTVDLIECVECAAEVARKRIHRRRGSLRPSPVPLPAADSCKVGFCTCVRQSHTCRTPSTPSCYDTVGWIADNTENTLQKTPLQHSLRVSLEDIDDPPANR